MSLWFNKNIGNVFLGLLLLILENLLDPYLYCLFI